MKKLTILLLAFLPIFMWAHEDSFYIYQYDNVTVRFKTGFFFEEINNAKIIGQYAAILSDSLDYDKPILLDFVHDYGYSYQGKTYSFVNIGSAQYDLVSYYEKHPDEPNVYYPVPYADINESNEHIEKRTHTITSSPAHDTVVLRQFGFHFDVTQTMNLLYYVLTNENEVKNLAKPISFSSYLTNMNYRFETIPAHDIDSIKTTSFPYIEKVLQNKVYKDVDTIDRHRLYYSYFSQNGKHIVFAGLHDKEVVLDTLDKIYFFSPRKSIPETLFVFETPNRFRKYNYDSWSDSEHQIQKSKQHTTPIDPHEYIVWITIDWLGDDIYFINYNNSLILDPFARFPYLAKDDVLIEDFEEYLNTYRKEKN